MKRKPMPKTPGGRPKTISKSKIISADYCEWSWKLKYIDGILTKATPNMAAGSAIHHAIEQLARAKVAGSMMTLDVFQRHAHIYFAGEAESGFWLPGCDTKKEIDHELWAMRAKIDRLSAAWYQDNAATIQPYLFEQWFDVPITVGGETILLNGRMDMIERDLNLDGGFRMKDYKFGFSSSAKQSQAVADTDLGLTMYKFANDQFFKIPVTSISLDCYKIMAKGVKHEEYVTQRDESDVKLLLTRAAAVCEMTRLKFYRPAPVGAWMCKPDKCGHYAGCPYAQRVSL